jgi:hypothetical protein
MSVTPEGQREPLESIYDAPGAPEVSPPTPTAPEPAQPDVAAAAPEPQQAEDPPARFSDEHRQPFVGLAFLGKLDHSFEWVGHRFHIRTLRSDELVEVARVVRDHAGSDGYLKAYQGAITAACVVAADGQPLPGVPLTPDQSVVEVNYRWVMQNWFPPVLDKIYSEYVELEVLVREVLEAMGNRSG